MTIYNIPSIVKSALPLALTHYNIVAGFNCTGIYPFNRDIFTELDSVPSYVTDRPAPGNTTPNATEVASEVSTLSSSINDDILRASPNNHTVPITRSTHIPPATLSSYIPPALPSSSEALFSVADPGPSTSKAIFSPEVVRPFPKALPRKTSSKRRSRKSAIYTDTPEKNAIQEDYDFKKQIKRKLTELKDEQKPVQKSKNTKSKNYLDQSDSDEENCFCLVCLELYGNSRPGEKWVQCIQTNVLNKKIFILVKIACRNKHFTLSVSLSIILAQE
ncbi:hypothetical protein JTB14_031860 [Gonioctena quinquepunctata]|nr:hypothetical protein JTB14_031860 [Gonioctena quinquepunctata]